MPEPLMAQNVFDQLLKDRIIWLGSEVRDENANEICAKILLLAAEDSTKDIYLYIELARRDRSPRAWPSTTRCSSFRTTS